jgi:hypothetical protein
MQTYLVVKTVEFELRICKWKKDREEFEDTKGVIRICKWQKDREEFEDTKGAIRICKWQKDREEFEDAKIFLSSFMTYHRVCN